MADSMEYRAAAALALRERERKRRFAELYRDDPCRYAREVIKAVLTPDQESILRSVVENRRTAIQASHAIGKTFACALISNWWYDCWDQHIVYVTAPTWSQALGLTFKEIKSMRRRHGLPGRIMETGYVKDDDDTLAAGHYIKAMNAETGEGFQGEHTAPILIVMEEAVGVPHYIWEATDGLMTSPECRLIAVANPTDQATNFGKASESHLYKTMAISGLDHPNIRAELACERPPYPNAIRLMYVKEMLEKECEQVGELTGDAFEFHSIPVLDAAMNDGVPATESSEKAFYLPTAVFQGRVLGQFPTQTDQQVIPKGWMSHLPTVPTPDCIAEIGCDVARYGTDSTTIAARRGPCVLKLKEIRQMSQEAVTGALIMMARDVTTANHPDPKKVPIRIDITGGLGTGPCDRLIAEGYNVEGVNASQAALDPETYPNRRSELWFTMRERARTRDLDLSRLPPDIRSRLVRELSTPKWKPDAKGKKVVEPKSEIKKRLGSSPDLADGVNLAFAANARRPYYAPIGGGNRPRILTGN